MEAVLISNIPNRVSLQLSKSDLQMSENGE